MNRIENRCGVEPPARVGLTASSGRAESFGGDPPGPAGKDSRTA